MNPTATPVIEGAWTYKAQALTPVSTPALAAGATVQPLLVDGAGNALMNTYRTADGRESIAMTFDSAFFLRHNLVLSYGVVNWLTYGLFLGQRQVYATPHSDDIFLENAIFEPTDSCVSPVYDTHYRLNAAAMQGFLAWQQAKRATPTLAGYRTTLPFNAYGPSPELYPADE